MASRAFQQQWSHDTNVGGVANNGGSRLPFDARHLASAEPLAALLFLQYILARYPGNVSCVAEAAEHYPIALVQQGENDFRGIDWAQYISANCTRTPILASSRRVFEFFFFFRIVGSLKPADSPPVTLGTMWSMDEFQCTKRSWELR
jgi:hypothetical protein